MEEPKGKGVRGECSHLGETEQDLLVQILILLSVPVSSCVFGGKDTPFLQGEGGAYDLSQGRSGRGREGRNDHPASTVFSNLSSFKYSLCQGVVILRWCVLNPIIRV